MNASDPMVAVAAHARSGNWPAALDQAERALEVDPFASPLLGFAALAALRLGDEARAEAFLRRQLAIASDDHAAAVNLATLLARSGRQAEALALARDHGGHPRLARLAGFLHQEVGEYRAAAIAYEAALAAHPEDAETWNNLGNALVETGDLERASAAFQNAINGGAPGHGVFLNLSSALALADNREGRVQALREGLARFPAHPELLLEFGLAEAAAGNFEAGIVALRQVAQAETSFHAAHLELGLLYENLNLLEELDELLAASANRGFDQLEMVFLQAWSLRRRSRFEEADVLARQIPASINPIRAAQLRAEIADRLGRTDEAFAEFVRMNQAATAARPAPAGPSFREGICAKSQAMEPRQGHPLPGGDGGQPVFLVGFPRSGTTLLDTVLSGYAELQVFEEQPMLGQVMSRFAGLSNESDPDRLTDARVWYIAQAEVLGGSASGRRIVDKHPLHMAQMPTIQRLFPEAAIVLVERHPCDVVLSCFMANFVLNPAMRSFTDLDEAARTYDAVFANWELALSLLPLRVHTVRYERMIADLEGELRPLTEFLGLPWRDDILDHQASAARRGHVRTASYAQVGQPLYGHAVERWRRYSKYLEPVLPILAPWAERMGYAL